MTGSQIAKELGISEATVSRILKDGGFGHPNPLAQDIFGYQMPFEGDINMYFLNLYKRMCESVKAPKNGAELVGINIGFEIDETICMPLRSSSQEDMKIKNNGSAAFFS
jgi:hypothetical protein